MPLVNCRLLALVAAFALALAACTSGSSPSATSAPTTTSSAASTPTTTSAAPLGSSGVPGVYDDRVVFGQSAAFSGPAEDLGNGMRLGIQAAFEEANRAGGVHGRQLELSFLDDAYEPEAAIVNTANFIERGEVFALIGAVGTPTSRSAVPLTTEADVPYIAPFTGAEFLRESELSNVINYRASYNQETEEMVARLADELEFDRISVLYQDDSFGQAGFSGARAALEKRNMEAVSVGLYPRNTTAVKTGLLDVAQGNPRAVIVIGAYQPVAELIRWGRELNLDALFVTISFVGSNALANELGSDGEGVFTTQVVPYFNDANVEVVSSYLDALAAHDGQAVPGFVSLEGYLAGRLAIAGLATCGRELTRECFRERYSDETPIDVDGLTLRFGQEDNQGSDQVFWTRINEIGEYEPFDDWSLVSQ